MFLFATDGGGQLSIGIVFWILFIVGLVFYGFRNYADRNVLINGLFFWIMIFLLGCGVFGFPVKF